MNGENFMKWVENRLLPAFNAKYPDKKMILILDNAPYHHYRGDDYCDPLKMKRQQLIDCLLGVAKKSAMTIIRNENNIEVNLREIRASKRGGRSSPTVKELQSELQIFFNDHVEEYQTGRLKKLFDELDYSLLFTPPYTPSLPPIELTWSYVKGYVARQFENNRSMEDTVTQLLNGFYGVPGTSHCGYTVELCRKHIAKCQRVCNEFIEADEFL